MEFLVVKFSGERGVIINGAAGAWMTNEILQLQAGSYIVTLTPPKDFTPSQITLVLRNTGVGSPRTIIFKKLPV